jgi:hypothetical protein
MSAQPREVLFSLCVRMCVQDDAIRNLFSAQTKSEYSVSSLLTFSAMFFLLAVLSYGESGKCPQWWPTSGA